MSTKEEGVQSQADHIVQALRDLKPSLKQQKDDLFAAIYPVIVDRIDSKVTQKEILALLAEHGLKLHPAKFKKLMATEAEARAARASRTTREDMA